MENEKITRYEKLGSFSNLQIQIFLKLLYYMINKCDAYGGIVSGDAAIVFYSIKFMLYNGIQAYICLKGVKPPPSQFVLLRLFEDVCDSKKNVNKVNELISMNNCNQFDPVKLFSEVEDLIENILIPESVWEMCKEKDEDLLNWRLFFTLYKEISLMNKITGWDGVYGKELYWDYEDLCRLIELSELVFDNW